MESLSERRKKVKCGKLNKERKKNCAKRRCRSRLQRQLRNRKFTKCIIFKFLRFRLFHIRSMNGTLKISIYLFRMIVESERTGKNLLPSSLFCLKFQLY